MLRKKSFNQGKQLVRALYPEPKIFKAIEKLAVSESCSAPEVQECFNKVCSKIRKHLLAQLAAANVSLLERGSGRPPGESERIRNDLRRLVYILVRDVEGLGWWKHVTKTVQRTTPGRRPRSRITGRFIDVLHYLCQGDNGKVLSEFLDQNALTDIANQLAYAHRHDVPFPFLIGFLRDVGFDEAARKERAGSYEEWYPVRPKRVV